MRLLKLLIIKNNYELELDESFVLYRCIEEIYSEGVKVMHTIDRCDKCGKLTHLQKYSYNKFYWMFCRSCYLTTTTKVSSYCRRN